MTDLLRDRAELAPLGDLRIRTPRLELRLGTRAEVRALGRLAEEGVHDPDEMPFAVPWTDAIGSATFLDEFVEFHAGQLDTWTEDDWNLNLLVWADGTLVGSQGIGAQRFATERTVRTGSWLGSRSQSRGIGTEMRRAVLELAFGQLDALAAESGWLEGNHASRRVSEKLGYVAVGVTEISPRGLPVSHHDLRLDAENWQPSGAVRIEMTDDCLALFGANKPQG